MRARFALSVLSGVLIGGAALLLGLVGATLRTGRIDPLDWLLPGLAALLILLLMGRHRDEPLTWRSIASGWALVAVPPMLLVSIAGSRPLPVGLTILAGPLALAAVIAGRFRARPARMRWMVAILLCLIFAAGRWAMLPRAVALDRSDHPPLVGVFSALPLYGSVLAEAGRGDLMADAARQSPLWQTLSMRHDLRPIDHFDAASLAPFRQLLIAQPRQLAPEELVALDDWVRRGGSALILVDPWLHWSDPRPLGHPQRAPLTSLLDPLLAHWGLRLEPAEPEVGADPVVRRPLEGGTLLQVAGASRFTLVGGDGATCRLDEQGFIATCAVGRGHARLVADADWINDALWTLDPASPHEPTTWTSDAIPALAGWLGGEPARVDSLRAWLVTQKRLISALRWALFILLLLAVVRPVLLLIPTFSHSDGHGPDACKCKKDGIRSDSG